MCLWADCMDAARNCPSEKRAVRYFNWAAACKVAQKELIEKNKIKPIKLKRTA